VSSFNKGVFEAFHDDSGARASRSYICTRWITFWSKSTWRWKIIKKT